MKTSIRAYSILIGTIIGAGIFGVPYAIGQSGLLSGIFFFLAVGVIMTLLHLMYGEVVLATRQKHRLPGFAQKYLGNGWGEFAKISSTLGYYGSLAIYLILGGKFAFFLAGPFLGGNELAYQLVYALLFGIFIFLGTNPVARIETVLTAALLGLLVILTAAGLFHFDFSNLPLVSLGVQDVFLPYGVLLFALFGIPAIPEMVDVLGKERQKLKKIIVVSVGACAGLTLLFALAAVGIAGSAVSPEAIQTFADVLGPWALVLGSAIGFLAISTSLLVIGLYLVDQFKYDFRLRHNRAFIAAMAPPVFLLLLTQNFILIMGFVGAVLGATDSMLLTAIWRRVKTKGDQEPAYRLRLSSWIVGLVMLVLIAGALQEILTLIY